MSQSFPSGLGEHCGGRDSRVVRSGRTEAKWCLLNMPGPRTMNSLQPWLAEQDQTSQHSFVHRRGTHKPPHLVEELLTVVAAGEGQSVFFRSVFPCKLTMLD